MKEVYLDNQSNTKLDERVFEAILPYFKDNYGNPQSMYSLGARSKDALDAARGSVAKLINCTEEELYFTSCGSESNNLAVKGVAAAYKQKGKHIVVKADNNLCAFADQESVKLIILNLFSNAITFTPNNGLITVSANERGNMTEVSIRDSGFGMKKEMVGNLFKNKETKPLN